MIWFMMAKMKKIMGVMVAATVVLAAASSNAITISSSGSVNGLPVNADGSLTAGAGFVMVTLNNLQANPTSAAQLISGLTFNVTGAFGPSSLTTVNSGTAITIAAGGTFTVDGTDPLTRWKATLTGTTVVLTTLSGGNPDRLIIGPPDGSGKYSAANPSIIGDNPSVSQSGMFTITVPGVTANSLFSNVAFIFNTDGTILRPPQELPDGGSTIGLLGMALVGAGLLRRRMAKA
jgi:hypothetical protein